MDFKRLIRSSNLILYFLSILVFFIIGARLAGVSGVADGQGLAGGAIVLMYGLLSSFLALVVALIAAYLFHPKTVKRVIRILGAFLALIGLLIIYRIITA